MPETIGRPISLIQEPWFDKRVKILRYLFRGKFPRKHCEQSIEGEYSAYNAAYFEQRLLHDGEGVDPAGDNSTDGIGKGDLFGVETCFWKFTWSFFDSNLFGF